jgi:hypothetical protein
LGASDHDNEPGLVQSLKQGKDSGEFGFNGEIYDPLIRQQKPAVVLLASIKSMLNRLV